jgi:hypothetical protein
VAKMGTYVFAFPLVVQHQPVSAVSPLRVEDVHGSARHSQHNLA